MKILRLEIHNVASIVDANIDFASGPLADEKLFLICGETGSGKTTILNSICLALYNSTPALLEFGSNDRDANGQTTRNPSQMLRRGTTEGWVNLDFEANDGVEYRASWSARSKKTRDGSVKIEVKTRIERAADGESVDAKAQDLTGLTFKQFTQTTMLAQGQFTKFLLADEAEKAEILEKLTGTEIYAAIGQRIYDTLRRKEADLKSLNDRIAGAKLLTDNEKQNLAAELAPLSAIAAMRQAEVDAIDKKLKWLADSAAIARRLEANTAERDSAEAETRSEQARSRAEAVRIWEETASVRRLMDEAAEAEIELAAARDSRPALNRRYAAILGAIDWLRAEMSARQAEYEALGVKIDEAEGLDIEGITGAATAKRNEAMALSRALSSLDRYHAAKIRRAEADAAVKAAEADIALRRAEIERLNAAVPPLDSDCRLKQARLDGMMELKDHIRSLRQAFADSRECPLCGNKEAHLASDAIIDDKLAEAHALAAEAKAARDKATAALARAEAEAAAIDKDLGRKRRQQASDRAAETSARAAALKDAAAVGVDCEADDYATAIERRMAAAVAAARAYEQKLSVAALEARVIEAERSIAPLASGFGSVVPGVRAEMPRLTAEISALIAAASALDGRIESLTARLADRRRCIGEYLAGEDSFTPEQIKAVARLTAADISASKAKIKAVADRLVAATAALDEVKRQSAEHQASKPEMAEGETTESLAIARRQATTVRDEAAKRQAAVEALLADDERRAKALEQAMRERDALQAERADWTVLESLYGGARGQKFRLMAQCYVLRTLLHKANYYLAMLSSRYQLCCADDSLVIHVVDRDNGNSVRAVTLLSGGEGFIVSLALALGLSAISKERLDVDTLFIDEGFGTLDSATLETVLTALDRLHSIGGRRVGIISHVSGLAERIPTQIRLRRTAPAASTATVVTL